MMRAAAWHLSIRAWASATRMGFRSLVYVTYLSAPNLGGAPDSNAATRTSFPIRQERLRGHQNVMTEKESSPKIWKIKPIH
eukprot:m.154534 g.154534  ORF g.154534 m.154534 type:complete len:81 (-) comp14378_c0_seq2:116-358(-)